MDNPELVGGVLFDTDDPEASARRLCDLLIADRADSALARQAGFDPALVESLRNRLPRDPRRIELACANAAAWVLGRRAVSVHAESWEVVASLSGVAALPSGLRRTTGETLIGLVASAETRIRVAAPYIDEPGLGFLGDSIVAATRRGVSVEMFEPRWSEAARKAISGLEERVRANGDVRSFLRVRLVKDAPFSHLKVIVVDKASAYIGSANLTSAGLAGRNLELGVLVRGGQVDVINRLLDLYRESG